MMYPFQGMILLGTFSTPGWLPWANIFTPFGGILALKGLDRLAQWSAQRHPGNAVPIKEGIPNG